MKKLTSAFLAGALALGAASTADAANVILTPGSGWTEFTFGGVGSAFSDAFDFTVTSTTVFNITDAYKDGDQFAISGGGGFFVLTSTPTNDGTDVSWNYDAALSNPKFSSLSVLLPAGVYHIIGKVVKSPYGSGAGAVELISAPEPASWALLIAGFGLVGGMLRRRIKASEVTYKTA